MVPVMHVETHDSTFTSDPSVGEDAGRGIARGETVPQRNFRKPKFATTENRLFLDTRALNSGAQGAGVCGISQRYARSTIVPKNAVFNKQLASRCSVSRVGREL